MLAVLATGLAEGQNPGDLELVVCAGENTQLQVTHRRVGVDELATVVDDLLQSRYEFFRSIDALDIEDARHRGHQVATTVVLIEDRDGSWARSEELAHWSRSGRAAGINLVVGALIPPPEVLPPADDTPPARMVEHIVDTASGSGLLASMATTTIVNRRQGRATLRTGTRSGESVLTDFDLIASV
ncbi:hypothetical protein FIV07_28155 (plasmid) [Mycobacterium sp. THAF192]|nr:hypothetical protein FIV07_28155 [Mycobacterium sp. THAF192]